MPLRNRVAPDGEIIAVPHRGTFMGNRGGVLHNDEREIVCPFASRRWITCVLEFKDRHRTVMSPRRYTELFFLDEAVSLAAGHRPCAECRRARFRDFKNAWVQAGMASATASLYADDMDLELHRTRIDREKKKVTWEARLDSLPSGSFVRIASDCFLVWGENLFRWSAGAYVEKKSGPARLITTVLTPKPIVACLRHGFTPEIHDSAKALFP